MFAITDEGCTQLNDSAERIEYHDPFPDEFMARLRRIYGASPEADHDDFSRGLSEAGLTDFVQREADEWLHFCHCQPGRDHADRCEIGLVLASCDVFADTVETEFERIQNWYRMPRFAIRRSRTS